MGKFLRTILVGVGIGLLIAPMSGKELRRVISERLQNMQDSLDRRQQSASGDMTPTESNLKEIGEASENTSRKSGMVRQPYQPAYPEYVKPDQG
jgi:gas vesicle protein